MTNQYIVGIDETGTFEKRYGEKVSKDKEKASRVGGVVWKNCSSKDIQNCIEDVCHQWNLEHRNCEIKIQDLLHYFELRGCYTWQKSKLPKEQGETLTNQIVAAIHEMDGFLFPFSSSGFPLFFANEQQAYVDILRSTLWGLLSKELSLVPGDSVHFVIAPRSKAEGTFGIWKPVNREMYHQFILEQLKEEFGSFAKNNNVEISFVPVAFPHLPELIASDFFLGNEKTKAVPITYRKLHFQDYQNLIMGMNPIDSIVDSYENGNFPPVSAFLAILHLDAIQRSEPTENRRPVLDKLEKILRDILPQETEMEELISTLDKNISKLLAQRTELAQHITTAESYCQTMLKLNSMKHIEKYPIVLRLQEVLLRSQIAIESHRGAVSDSKAGIYILQYQDFFTRYTESIYPTIGERLIHLLDAELKSIQLSHFNNYNFSEVEKIFDPHYQRYSRLYQKYREVYRGNLVAGEKDAVLGKLCGTLGQANAFLYAIHREETYYEMAALQLEEDTNQFLTGSRSWGQGMQYRIQLEFCHKDIARQALARDPMLYALELMQKLFNVPELISNSLFALITDKSTVWDISLTLKFLAYNRFYNPSFPIPVEEIQRIKRLIQGNQWPWYPLCHIVKWTACLAFLSNEVELAREIVDIMPELTEQNFTFQTLEIPMIMFKAFLKSKHPKPCLEKLEQVMEEQPFFKACMEQGNWKEKFSTTTTKKWNLWDIMTMLPFYYC